MKKVLLLAIVALLTIGSVFATTDFKLAVGVKNTGLDININKDNGSKLNSDIEFNLDTEFDVFFKDGLGMNVVFGAAETFSRFNLGVGFAYNLPINTNWDFVVSVGPIFSFTGGRNNTMGIFSHFDFDFIGGKYFFARIGTGLDITFLEFGEGQSDTFFEMLIPVPRVAIGWQF